MTENRNNHNPVRVPESADWAELIETLAHAIRNPLTGISVNVQYLQMIQSKEMGHREIYADIMEAVARLDQMISEFVEFTGEIKLKLELVDLNILLSRALAYHDNLLLSRRLCLETDLNGALPEVEADLQYFSRALEGLIEHCAWETPENGWIRAASRMTPESVFLEVSHSGPPLSAPRLETLFDPIAALKGPESGFGMAFVRKIIHEHGCHLEVDSRPDQRTLYTVVVPLSLPLK